MRYEIGDKVKIKKDIESMQGGSKPMAKFEEKIVTISKVEKFRSGYRYSVIEDDGEWYWYPEMIKRKAGKCKGWEIFRMVADGELEEGCKIKDIKGTVYEFDDRVFRSIKEPSYTGILIDDYDDFCLAKADFEIIEEEPEEQKEINIQDIEEIQIKKDVAGTICVASNENGVSYSKIDLEFAKKINEIIRYLKQEAEK